MPDQNQNHETGLAANELDLTEAERTALAPDDSDAGSTSDPDPAGNDQGADDQGTDGEADDSAAPVATSEQDAANVAEPPGAPAGIPPPPTNPSVFVPKYNSGEGRNFSEEIEQVNAQLIELKGSYKAGDIDDDEYEQRYEALRDQRGKVELDQRTAVMKQEMTQDMQDQAWVFLQRQFLNDPANAPLVANRLLFAAWEQAMQDVVDEAVAANQRPPEDWAIMVLARQKLADAGMVAADPQRSATADPAPTPAKPNRNPQMQGVPQTLSAIPAAADPSSRETVDTVVEQNIEDLEAYLSGRSESERDQMLKDVPGSFLSDA
ncbi:MAG: hypothetical protein LBL59_08755 [Xanthomonadaceae bacterium]|jgi:hypothetical protein|nr:hypothetical protein [Xanthomonadaceae bacterium]